MANKYEFEVTGNVQDTVKKLNQISQLQDRISQKGETMLKGGYSSSSNFQDLIKDMRLVDTLSNTVNGDLTSLQKQASTKNNGSALIDYKKQAEDLQTTLKSTKQLYDNLLKTSGIGASRGAQQQARRDFAMGNSNGMSASRARADQEEIRRRQREVNNLGSRQRDRATRANDSGHMSYIDNQRFQRDSSMGGQSLSEQQSFITNQRKRANESIKNAQGSIPKASKDLASGKIDEKAFNKIIADAEIMEKTSMSYIKSLASLEAATRKASQDLKTSDAQMSSSGASVEARKGSAADIFNSRLTSTVSNTANALIGNTTSRYKQGKQINQSTWDQAVQIGNSSDMSSAQVRSVASKSGIKNGFGMADSLGFMQLSQMANGGSNTNPSGSYMNTLMKNSRSSGFGNENYQDLMTNVISGGAGGTSKEVNSITNSAVGSAKNSGTMGLLQTQVKYLSQIAKNQSSTIGTTTKGTNNVSATQGQLAKSGSSAWKSEAGGNNLNTLNSSITAAGKMGGNDPMLRAIINSDTTKFGGVPGYAKAQAQSEKGLTDPDNVRAIVSMAKARSGSSIESQALTVEQITGLGETASQALIKTSDKGDLSKSSINKALDKNEKTGNNTKDKNGNKIANSTDLSTAKADSQREANMSQLQQETGKYVSSISNAVNRMPPLLTAVLTAVGVGAASIIKAIAIAGISGDLKNVAGSGKNGNSGWMSTLFGNAEKNGKNATKISAAEFFSNKSGLAQTKSAKFAYNSLASASSVLGNGKNFVTRNAAKLIPKAIPKSVGKFARKVPILGTVLAAADMWGTYDSTKAQADAESEAKNPNASKKDKKKQEKKNRNKAVKKTAKEGIKFVAGMEAAGAAAGATETAMAGANLAGPGGWVVSQGASLLAGAAGFATGSGLAGMGEDAIGKGWNKLTGNKSKKDNSEDKKKNNLNQEDKALDKYNKLLDKAKQQNGIIGKTSKTTTITKNSSATRIEKAAQDSTATVNATGNVVNSPTLSYIAEHQQETVVPTGGGSASNGRSKQLARYAAQQTGVDKEFSGGGSSINMPITININGNATKEDASAIANTLKSKLQTSVFNNSRNYTPA